MRSSRRPAPDIRRGSRRPPRPRRLLPGLLGAAASARAPLRSTATEAPASLFLAKFGVTGIAGVGGRSVGGSHRCLVAGLDCGHKLPSGGLNCRNQLIDMVASGEDLRINFTPVHI